MGRPKIWTLILLVSISELQSVGAFPLDAKKLCCSLTKWPWKQLHWDSCMSLKTYLMKDFRRKRHGKKEMQKTMKSKCITFLPVVSWYRYFLQKALKPEVFDLLLKIQLNANRNFRFDEPLTSIVSPPAFIENVQTANGWEVGRAIEPSTWRLHPTTTITVSKKRNWLQQSTLGRTQYTKEELQAAPGAEDEGAPQPPPSPSPSPDAVRLQGGVPPRLPHLHQPQVGKPG